MSAVYCKVLTRRQAESSPCFCFYMNIKMSAYLHKPSSHWDRWRTRAIKHQTTTNDPTDLTVCILGKQCNCRCADRGRASEAAVQGAFGAFAHVGTVLGWTECKASGQRILDRSSGYNTSFRLLATSLYSTHDIPPVRWMDRGIDWERRSGIDRWRGRTKKCNHQWSTEWNLVHEPAEKRRWQMWRFEF